MNLYKTTAGRVKVYVTMIQYTLRQVMQTAIYAPGIMNTTRRIWEIAKMHAFSGKRNALQKCNKFIIQIH